mmetsp:Transcript_29758/g.84995  ORF Transcript_29758/g.84995 Transcript_29758/m.84995 type:complete len:241 (-) Transcript_29758:139-861(-)
MPWPTLPSRARPTRWAVPRTRPPSPRVRGRRAGHCSIGRRSSSSRRTTEEASPRASGRSPGARASPRAARTITGSTCRTTWSCCRSSSVGSCAAPSGRTSSTRARPLSTTVATATTSTRCASTRRCRRTSACTTTATSQRTRCCGSRRRQAATSWRTSTCGASWTSCTPHRAGVGTRTTVRWARGTCSPPSASTRWRAPRTRWSSGAPPSLAPPCACRETAGALRSWPRTRGGRTSTSSR